jgi:septum site-determining protein MinD
MCRLPVHDIMKGTVLVVTSGKGGVGKSTTALNLGVALGAGGNSVVVVDADLGMANLGAMAGVDGDGATLHDVLAGDASVDSTITAGSDAFDVVPGARDLAGYADADPGRIPDVLAALAERYEYVVVDAGAGLGYADVVPIEAAGEVVLVTTPTDAAIGDTAKLVEFAGIVDTPIRGVVVTRAGDGIDAESIAADVGGELLGVVPEDPAVTESTEAGVPLEQHAPDSPAAAAYRRLAGVVTGRSASESDDATGGPEAVTEATADAPGTEHPTEAGEAPETTAAGFFEEADATSGDPSGPLDPEEDGPPGGRAGSPGEEQTEDDSADENSSDGLLSRLRGMF